MKNLDFSNLDLDKPEPVQPVAKDLIQYDLKGVQAKLSDFARRGELVKKQAFDIEVKDDKTKELATEIGSKVHNFLKQIDAKADEYIAEPKDYVSKVNNFTKKVRKPYEEAKEYLREQLRQHKAREELAKRKQEEAIKKKNQELQKELDQEAKKTGIKAPKVEDVKLPEHENITRADSGISFGKKQPTFEVVNLEDVPREYLKIEVSKKAVKDAMRQGVTEIPGLKLKWEEDIAFR